MTMDVLIIGGSGHVSGATARAAVAQGHRVWTVTRGQRPLPEGVTALTADRTDTAALRAALDGAGMQWDLVVDCIAYQPEHIRQDIELLRNRAGQLVFISTDFTYAPRRRCFPQLVSAPTLETQDGPGSLDYGQKKRLAELELAKADTGAMKWTVLRPCHIYGPTSELGCLPFHGRDVDLIARLRRGEALRLVGGGYFLQQPILADDLAKTILSAGGNRNTHGRIYNAAGPDIIESREYYRIIADILGVGLTIEEASVQAALTEHPEMAPFFCHRIYDLSNLRADGLAVPATLITDGLRLHVEQLLARTQT